MRVVQAVSLAVCDRPGDGDLSTSSAVCVFVCATGQAMEIGSVAINILIETWEGHLTPQEVATLADRASRGRDPNMVRAAAELALSCLPHAPALNPREMQRALNQCQEQSGDMLQQACLAAEGAAKGGGVYPEVLFDVAHRWYSLYEEVAQVRAGDEMMVEESFDAVVFVDGGMATAAVHQMVAPPGVGGGVAVSVHQSMVAPPPPPPPAAQMVALGGGAAVALPFTLAGPMPAFVTPYSYVQPGATFVPHCYPPPQQQPQHVTLATPAYLAAYPHGAPAPIFQHFRTPPPPPSIQVVGYPANPPPPPPLPLPAVQPPPFRPALPPPTAQQAAHMNYLQAAYRVGMLAIETLGRRVHDDRPQAKYARNPPYNDDVKWVLAISLKLGEWRAQTGS